MDPTSGGFLIIKTPLVRTGRTAHTTSLDRPVSDLDIEAINAVQAVPWRINRWLLDVLSEAYDRGLDIPGIETGREPPLPPRMSDAAWAALPPPAKKAHSETLRDCHAKRATIRGRRQALLDKLMVANEMRDYESIWFPHTKDFRGRIYPLPVSGPHPQSDDVGKALLMFAEGKALGEDGEFWLRVRAANAYGMDKLPLEERVEWTFKFATQITASADHPMSCEWWREAPEPWSFLATCWELSLAISSPSPSDFNSHLPIPMDGSCNGLQHLSAMGLDPIGAAATNLRPGPRQDIYAEVAAHVAHRVEEDANAGVLEALQWRGKVSRGVVKRSVMTTPYGVTAGGIRTQLLNDGHVPEGDSKSKLADYLKARLIEALEATVQSGKAIMAWLQGVAEALAAAGLPFDWSTPTGSRCRQAYYEQTRRRIETLCGTLTLAEECKDGIIAGKKQALGSAPNYVHSFDAAHLSLTVVAAHRAGITGLALVHDSFGTHACDTTLLARILREEFVEMYKTDWLTALYDEIRRDHPHVQITPPPARGDFQIEEVLGADFFFS